MANSKKEKSSGSSDSKVDSKDEKKGHFWNSAKSRAEKVIKSPDDLADLLDKATKKANAREKGPLVKVWDSLLTLMRIARAYKNGSYRKVPWQSMVMIIAAIVYFVMPVDAIPDFLAVIGFGDDIAVIGFTVRTLGGDIADFLQWEAEQKEAETELKVA